jgi:large subunit ribosomal protein L16
MALIPSRVKYRKQQRGNRAGTAQRGNAVSYGEYGLQALERCWLPGRQIEAARVAITRSMKRRGKLWIRIFPDKPVSKKPLEVRMGSGKGAVDRWVAVVRPARMLFEVDGVSEDVARQSLRLAANKLSIRTRFVTRQQHG